ncbi:kinase-like protein [Lophiostoma macrostomum CBS 122681]|uniref:Kinase-like protein n=1 Tax=Lophiostoma macrostomum CBS 122681 TaxID=1314788 RepID=A0A6A6TGE9_9PLEO|nr:kinase-like protein [Lophiostoma macrostomum CBS 122681]
MIDSQNYIHYFAEEDLEDYGNDGLYPVEIGDKFHDGRYCVRNKLGFGANSTVWVAQDNVENRLVTLKIIKAKHSQGNRELAVLQRLQQGSRSHPGHRHIPQLLGHFYEGKIGNKNLFIVLELLGPRVLTVLDCREDLLEFSQQLSKQLLLAIDYLHSHGVVHGVDIHINNILFRLPTDCPMAIGDVKKKKVQRIDGGPIEAGLPTYIVKSMDDDALLDHPNMDEQDWIRQFECIQLIDFSSSFLDHEITTRIHVPANMTPPELLFNKPVTKSVDIWSLACTVYHFIRGTPLLITVFGGLELVPQMHKLLGESSAHWLLTALFDSMDDIKSELEHILGMPEISQSSPFEEYLAKQVDKKDIGKVIDFLRAALVVDPAKRATTQELQRQAWILEEGS